MMTIPFLLVGCEQATTSPEPTKQTAQAIVPQVESKWTLRDDQAGAARSKLNLQSSSAEERSLYFYDTLELDLYRQGLILRARKVKDAEDDSTVKFRPMTITEAGSYLGTSGFKCEIDALEERQVSSCSLTTVQPTGQIDEVREGLLGIKKLFSSEQEDFAQLRAEVDWSELRVLGPTPARVWKKSTSSLAYPYTVEQWILPSGAVITEISTKTSQADAEAAAAALKKYLTEKGLVVSSEQETKTQRTLNEWVQRNLE